MAQIIELTSRNGLDYLHGLLERGQDMRPVLRSELEKGANPAPFFS